MVKTEKPGNAKPALVAAAAAAAVAHQRMLQKNFFSRNGFSEAGTGTMRGSSRVWASQYAIRSAAALETWGVDVQGTDVRQNFKSFHIYRNPSSI